MLRLPFDWQPSRAAAPAMVSAPMQRETKRAFPKPLLLVVLIAPFLLSGCLVGTVVGAGVGAAGAVAGGAVGLVTESKEEKMKKENKALKKENERLKKEQKGG
jgi:hypothetical protein